MEAKEIASLVANAYKQGFNDAANILNISAERISEDEIIEKFFASVKTKQECENGN